MAVKDKVRSFVLTNFYVADPAQLVDATSLLDLGIIDSTGVLEIISFVEREFEIVVLDDEMVPENFASVKGISAYIDRKLQEQGGGEEATTAIAS